MSGKPSKLLLVPLWKLLNIRRGVTAGYSDPSVYLFTVRFFTADRHVYPVPLALMHSIIPSPFLICSLAAGSGFYTHKPFGFTFYLCMNFTGI